MAAGEGIIIEVRRRDEFSLEMDSLMRFWTICLEEEVFSEENEDFDLAERLGKFLSVLSTKLGQIVYFTSI